MRWAPDVTIRCIAYSTFLAATGYRSYTPYPPVPRLPAISQTQCRPLTACALMSSPASCDANVIANDFVGITPSCRRARPDPRFTIARLLRRRTSEQLTGHTARGSLPPRHLHKTICPTPRTISRIVWGSHWMAMRDLGGWRDLEGVWEKSRSTERLPSPPRSVAAPRRGTAPLIVRRRQTEMQTMDGSPKSRSRFPRRCRE